MKHDDKPLRSGVRQVSDTILGIRQDHIDRYQFAAEHVSGRVLDVGCGVGYGYDVLGCDDYLGIDYSVDAIDYAKTFYGGKHRVLDAGDISTLGKFDSVVCLECLEHVKMPHKLLKDIYNILNDNGVFVISIPLEPHKRHRFHLTSWTESKIEDSLVSAGFKIKETTKQVYRHKGRTKEFIIAVAYKWLD